MQPLERDIGQIGTYINIVDDIVRTNADGKTIGLIICKEKNNVLAKYAVNSSNEPIAISAYELSNFLPDDTLIVHCQALYRNR